MELAELSPDQRRRLVDATQVFEAWREADREFRHSYRGALRWKTINGTQYLYRTFGKIGNSLGPRSPELEKVKADYTEQRTRLRRHVTALETRLKDMARLNRAFNLGRVPTIAARILRKLDQEGLLGKHLFVVSPDQRRRLVDATQVFEAWREVDREFRHSYRGALRWKTING